MRTKFWRFAYEKEQLSEILASHSLCFPDLKRWPQAKNNTEEKVLGAMLNGHFVLLANFDRSSEIGTVRGVGLIDDIEDGHNRVIWKKPVPSWDLTPDARGGVQQWINEGVFCFDAPPAKRYKLEARTKKLFGIS
jgi:hypothetical protein